MVRVLALLVRASAEGAPNTDALHAREAKSLGEQSSGPQGHLAAVWVETVRTNRPARTRQLPGSLPSLRSDVLVQVEQVVGVV